MAKRRSKIGAESKTISPRIQRRSFAFWILEPMLNTSKKRLCSRKCWSTVWYQWNSRKEMDLPSTGIFYLLLRNSSLDSSGRWGKDKQNPAFSLSSCAGFGQRKRKRKPVWRAAQKRWELVCGSSYRHILWKTGNPWLSISSWGCRMPQIHTVPGIALERQRLEKACDSRVKMLSHGWSVPKKKTPNRYVIIWLTCLLQEQLLQHVQGMLLWLAVPWS